jgi:hypothetical protein
MMRSMSAEEAAAVATQAEATIAEAEMAAKEAKEAEADAEASQCISTPVVSGEKEVLDDGEEES